MSLRVPDDDGRPNEARTPPDGLRRDSMVGAACALSAFGMWGLIPIYFKAVASVPAVEVLAHRVVWSLVLLFVLVLLRRRWTAVVSALRDARTRLLLLASTTLVSINWLVFIWAIGHDRVLEASLGYYINPLMNILLGVLVLRERLTGWQGAAVALAVAGVLNLGLRVEGFPWVSLALAGSFSLYGLLRKTMRVESVDGLFVETALLTLIALSYLVVLGVQGTGAFSLAEPGMAGLLMLSGAVTAIPLILFASGARRLDYATVGFFQYVAPSGQFLLAVLVYHEPFTPAHLVTFALIWTALAIFSVQSFGAARRRPVGR